MKEDDYFFIVSLICFGLFILCIALAISLNNDLELLKLQVDIIKNLKS